jgi:uridine kinase
VSPITSFKTDKQLLTSKNLRLLRRIVRDIKRRNTSAEKTINMWPEVTEVEEKYIEPFRTKVDYFVDTTHQYELGVYKAELQNFIKEGKIKENEIPFKELLDGSYEVSKTAIPDTSLMWEFVDKD